MSKYITLSEVRGWLTNAGNGEAITYFRGFLALVRGEGDRSPSEAVKPELIRVADYLWREAQHDRVHLVQVRHGVGDYTYVVVARGASGEDRRTTVASAADPVETPS
jgi:hypothetical protein